MILGLDCSSSVCGYTLLNDNESLVDIGYLDFKDQEDLYEKLYVFREFLLEFERKYSIDSLKIYIEEPLMMFGKGKSMAQVLAKLQRFNGMVSAAIYSDLEIKPVLINASHARKLCNIKTIRGENTKKIILSHVQSLNIIPKEKWEYKRTGTDRETNFDMADSYVVALAGIRSEIK